ncbi:hypothetical protein GCM10025867_50410 (plasmid) [Frondihabitans sucicola]|uniref:Uncharacterized protein n=1 Tax=Frondihabitans sucicola TaxID=1268041 RepID=A0ABM8GWD8_9MICO|nr:hypothetical protein [Frondihabitans sucicola]BDZ52800.1 hypothetical protein GCM10025867_50410 [Frondihabitans sucicola]
MAFYAALNAITWGRNSGGVIWYNSEYNEGQTGASFGGGDRISNHYGPLGEAAHDAHLGYLIAR